MNLVSDWRKRVVFAYIDEPPFATPLSNGAARGCDIELALTGLHAIGVREVELRLTTFAELLPASPKWPMDDEHACVREHRTPRHRFLQSTCLGARRQLRCPRGNQSGITSYRAIADGRRKLALVAGQINAPRSQRASARSSSSSFRRSTRHCKLCGMGLQMPMQYRAG
jgi:polar amino acid transport system substrate-binding protein